MKRILFLFLIGISIQAAAQEKLSVDAGQILIDGYDPVSYFEGYPKRGRLIFHPAWMDAISGLHQKQIRSFSTKNPINTTRHMVDGVPLPWSMSHS